MNKAQFSVLEYVVKNCKELIEELAKEEDLSESASVGIAEFLVADIHNFSKMTAKQLHHFQSAIEPLISNVQCEGLIGRHEDDSSSCINDGYIDDDDLLMAYISRDMRCQQCIATKDSWYENNP